MKQFVFVYGTLKQGHGNNRLLNRAKFVGPAVTVSSTFKMLDGGFPMVLSDGLFKVRGELFEVPDQLTLDNLDRLEGHPDFFHRHNVQVQVLDDDGVNVNVNEYEAFMYVGNPRYDGRGNYIIPDQNNECEWN